MKFVVAVCFIATLACADALSIPSAVSTSLRPSTAAFRSRISQVPEERQQGLALKGGGGHDFQLDTSTLCKVNGAVWIFYGLLCVRELGLPLIDITGKSHKTGSSIFFGEMTPDTPILLKFSTYVGIGFSSYGALNVLIGEKGTPELQKEACKINVAVHAVAALTQFYYKQPWQAGGKILAPLFTLLFALPLV